MFSQIFDAKVLKKRGKVDPFNANFEIAVFGGSKIFKLRFLRFNKKGRSTFEAVASVDLIYMEKTIKSCGQVGAHRFFLPRLKITFWQILT